MEDFKEQKTALGYIMGSRIINKGGLEKSGQLMCRSFLDMYKKENDIEMVK